MRYTTRYTAGFCQDLRPCGCCMPQFPICDCPSPRCNADCDDKALFFAIGYLVGRCRR